MQHASQSGTFRLHGDVAKTHDPRHLIAMSRVKVSFFCHGILTYGSKLSDSSIGVRLAARNKMNFFGFVLV